MKKLFSDEVANELGYQKYWPERKDWLIAIVGTLLFCGMAYGIAIFSLQKSGYIEREEQKTQVRTATILEWCKNTPVKNLAETKECLLYQTN